MSKSFIFQLLSITLFAYSVSASAIENDKDEVLNKLLDWHIGFATNQAQYDADKAAGAKPAWALSELRFVNIWPERTDGYWLYYEVSQPQIRPDRNEIWNLYRNELGDLKVDVYRFNDIERGLTFWGKWKTPEVFEDISIEELTTFDGCNGTYHWIEKSNKFSGINSHYECPVGNGYILQHIEISKDTNGVLHRNDWHWFFDDKGIAKTGAEFKLGNMGPYIHQYELDHTRK